jgi:uncharacterized protein YqgC (DUF456 family)
MEITILIVGTLLLLLAFIGCFVPVMPGPVLAYVTILLRHFFSEPEYPYSITALVALGVAMAVVFALDYVLPVWAARKSGGSKYGARGALIGMLVGIFFTPIGMLTGMFLGALVGELLHDSSNFSRALRVACYSFLGFLLSVGVKFTYCAVAAWWFYFPQ